MARTTTTTTTTTTTPEANARRGFGVLGLLAAALALVPASCGDDDPPRASAPPGIVLFCLDTLRKDGALGANAGVPWMPAVSAFARDATSFEDATSSSAWTAPSVATLLTGLLPYRHGVQGEHTPLVPAVSTLAERLKAHGWHTAAFTAGGWLVAQTGFAQGFDQFEATFDAVPPGGGPERAILSWERSRPPGTPFFLFLHTYAPHDPYGRAAKEDARSGRESPEEEAFARRILARLERGERTVTDAERRRFLMASTLDGRARNSYGKVLGAGRPYIRDVIRQSIQWLDDGLPRDPGRGALFERLRTAYFEGLSYADDVFRRTLDALAHLPKDTVFVVVSDHGEAFGEHDTILHGRWLYDEFVRVPLLVRAPGRLPPGSVRGSCGVLDVASTVLDLAGASPPSAVDGRSLLPLARGSASGHPVIAQETREDMVGGGLAGTKQHSVRTEAAKLLVDVDPRARTRRETLYDLRADPGEKTPLPADDLGRFGAAFVEAVERVRSFP